MTPDLAGLDLVADPAFAVDQDFRVVAANRACSALLGESIARWIGEVPLELVHPDDLAIVLSSFTEVADKEFGTPIEVRVQVADGTYRLMEVVGATHPHGDGHIVVVSMRDLTQRRRWELAAGHAERFRAVVEHASVVLALTDASGRVDSASGTFNRHLGHDQSRVVGSNLADWVVPDERAPFRAALARAAASPRTSVFEAVLQHADGRLIPYQFSVANLLGDPVVAGLIVSGSDISARRALEARLTQLATTDPLTGLANRAALVTDLATRLALHTTSNLVVFFIDLDRFKPVNDLHGHDAGDTVLAILAQRLGGLARTGDLIARLGGDEFVMVCDGVEEHDALTISRRIEEAVAAPIDVGGAVVQVFASVGHADGAAASTADGLLAEADAAMYRVKQRRRGRPSGPSLPVAHRRGLVADLTAALADDPVAAGLRVYFQPVVALPTGAFAGAEALVRWEHPVSGLLSPAEFLPIAEDAGLDLALGRWIIDTALAQAAGWPDDGSIVAVNLGAGELTDPSAVDMVLDALDRNGMRPSRLCVEVTETTLLERAAAGNRVAAITALERLKHAGVRVAIDDFGTGYSSLVHVRELPADTLKIDRSFVSGLPADEADRGIVAAVIALARGVGMTVVAEGVEHEPQHRALCALGAEFAQGYLYSRPMPAADLAAWREARERRRAS